MGDPEGPFTGIAWPMESSNNRQQLPNQTTFVDGEEYSTICTLFSVCLAHEVMTKRQGTPDITVDRVREIARWCQTVFRTHDIRGHSSLNNFQMRCRDMDARILGGAGGLEPGCIYSITANLQSSAMFRQGDEYFLVDTHGGDIGGIRRCASPSDILARLGNPASVDVIRVTVDDFGQFVQNPGQPRAVEINQRYIPHFPRNEMRDWEFTAAFQESIQRKANIEGRGSLSMLEASFLNIGGDFGDALKHWKLWMAAQSGARSSSQSAVTSQKTCQACTCLNVCGATNCEMCNVTASLK